MRKRNVWVEIPQNASALFCEICQAFNADNAFLLERIPCIRSWIVESVSADDMGYGLSIDFVLISEKHRLFGDRSRELMLCFDPEEVSFILDEETDHPIEMALNYSEVGGVEQLLHTVSDLLEQVLGV